MDFDRFTVVLLVTGPGDSRPAVDGHDPLQDEHLAVPGPAAGRMAISSRPVLPRCPTDRRCAA